MGPRFATGRWGSSYGDTLDRNRGTRVNCPSSSSEPHSTGGEASDLEISFKGCVDQRPCGIAPTRSLDASQGVGSSPTSLSVVSAHA